MIETGIISPSAFVAGNTTKEFFALLSLDGITSEPNVCALVELKLIGKIEFVGATAIEPEDKVLLTESDSLMGERRSVPRIGMEVLFVVEVNIEGVVANC